MRQSLSLLALSAVIAATPTVHAATITYTESATGSGTFDGKAFTSALITVSATGDTGNVKQNGSTFYSPLTTTVSVAGFTSDLFTDIISFIDNENSKFAGVVDQTANAGILLTFNPAFAAYDLKSALAATGGTNSYTNGRAFATKGGAFTLNSVDGTSAFQASVPTTASAPEPSSLVLLATGGLGLAAALRRRLGR